MVKKIVYFNENKAEVTFEIPSDKQVACICVQAKNILLQYEGGGFITLDKDYYSNVIVI